MVSPKSNKNKQQFDYHQETGELRSLQERKVNKANQVGITWKDISERRKED